MRVRAPSPEAHFFRGSRKYGGTIKLIPTKMRQLVQRIQLRPTICEQLLRSVLPTSLSTLRLHFPAPLYLHISLARRSFDCHKRMRVNESCEISPSRVFKLHFPLTKWQRLLMAKRLILARLTRKRNRYLRHLSKLQLTSFGLFSGF